MVRVLFPVNSSARQSRRPLTVSGACYKEWLILTDVYRGQQGNVEEFLIINQDIVVTRDLDPLVN